MSRAIPIWCCVINRALARIRARAARREAQRRRSDGEGPEGRCCVADVQTRVSERAAASACGDEEAGGDASSQDASWSSASGVRCEDPGMGSCDGGGPSSPAVSLYEWVGDDAEEEAEEVLQFAGGDAGGDEALPAASSGLSGSPPTSWFVFDSCSAQQTVAADAQPGCNPLAAAPPPDLSPAPPPLPAAAASPHPAAASAGAAQAHDSALPALSCVVINGTEHEAGVAARILDIWRSTSLEELCDLPPISELEAARVIQPSSSPGNTAGDGDGSWRVTSDSKQPLGAASACSSGSDLFGSSSEAFGSSSGAFGSDSVCSSAGVFDGSSAAWGSSLGGIGASSSVGDACSTPCSHPDGSDNDDCSWLWPQQEPLFSLPAGASLSPPPPPLPERYEAEAAGRQLGAGASHQPASAVHAACSEASGDAAEVAVEWDTEL